VAESRYQFAVVEFALSAQVAAVEQLIILGFLRDDMQHQSHLVHVGEDNFPLIELAAIEAITLGVAGPRPDILAVAADVHGEEIYRVHAFAGEIVERGTAHDMVFEPLHPYSRKLMGSIIVPEEGMKNQKLSAIPGAPPNLKHTIEGCRFADRCTYATAECKKGKAESRLINNRSYRCIFDVGALKEMYENGHE